MKIVYYFISGVEKNLAFSFNDRWFIMKIFLFMILSIFSFSCKDYDFKNIKVYNIYGNQVFHVWESEPLEDVDVGSFEILYGRLSSCDYSTYAKDKNKVYYRNFMIENADVNSFEIIDSSYSKDKNHIYYEGKVLEKSNVNLKTESYRLYICSSLGEAVCLINGKKKFYKDQIVKDFFKDIPKIWKKEKN